MKSIKQQYIDLTEGKMSQGNFMRNLRMTIPQYVTNVTSFGDAVRILKNKNIISEVLTTEEEVFSQGAQDESVTTTNTTAGYDSVSEENDETSNSDAEFDAMLKQLEDEMAGEIAVKSDKLDEPLEEINEGKEPKAVDEDIEEVTTGIQIEHECHPDMEYDEIEKMVKKNIKKNPLYYTNYKLTGIRGAEPVEFPSPKRKAGFDKPEEVSKKADNLIDTKNATQVIKEGLDNRDIASQIYDELQNMGSYNDTDIDLKIKKRGLTGPDAEAVRMIIFDKDREDMNEGYKLLPDPSKVKLKELVRKMMKEMFDGRDNVTDVTGENN